MILDRRPRLDRLHHRGSRKLLMWLIPPRVRRRIQMQVLEELYLKDSITSRGRLRLREPPKPFIILGIILRIVVAMVGLCVRMMQMVSRRIDGHDDNRGRCSSDDVMMPLFNVFPFYLYSYFPTQLLDL